MFIQEQTWRDKHNQSVAKQHLSLSNIYLFSQGNTNVCADFSSEEALLSYLRSSYDTTVSGREPGLLAAAQQLLSTAKTFFSHEADMLVRHTFHFHAGKCRHE